MNEGLPGSDKGPYDDILKSRVPNREELLKRMLGKRNFPKRTEEDKLRILQSGERVRALNAIETTTFPPGKKEMKKGAVLEIAERCLISDAVLKEQEITYIGSGTDAEYLLALGARHGTMVDPILDIPEARTELLQRIQRACGTEPRVHGDHISFDFDFGSGKEEVTMRIVSKFITPTGSEPRPDNYELPHGLGGIVMYAAQGPGSFVKADDALKSKIAEGGFLLEDLKFGNKREGKIEMQELGS